MSNQRIEKDLLGEKEIPKEAYYGIQTQRALENFPITGYTPNKELIKLIVMVKSSSTGKYESRE